MSNEPAALSSQDQIEQILLSVIKSYYLLSYYNHGQISLEPTILPLVASTQLPNKPRNP